jgi:hypothetical protein
MTVVINELKHSAMRRAVRRAQRLGVPQIRLHLLRRRHPLAVQLEEVKVWTYRCFPRFSTFCVLLLLFNNASLRSLE